MRYRYSNKRYIKKAFASDLELQKRYEYFRKENTEVLRGQTKTSQVKEFLRTLPR